MSEILEPQVVRPTLPFPREASSPDDSSPPVSFIEIRHPHPSYRDALPLLKLCAVEKAAVTGRRGLDYNFALWACGIITGLNTDEEWRAAWLSTSSNGNDFQPVAAGTTILTGSVYFFHTSRTDPQSLYPVVPSFQHWVFPHNVAIPGWNGKPPTSLHSQHFGLRERLIERDRTCRVTNHRNSTEAAHLIPGAELRWFNMNGMRRYGPPGSVALDVDVTENSLLLRADIHGLFDARRLAFIPRVHNQIPVAVTYVTDPAADPELLDLYHNRQLHPVHVPIQYLFARLAWTIFTDEMLGIFRSDDDIQYKVKVREGGQIRELEGLTRADVEAWIRALNTNRATGSRSRPITPQKRSQSSKRPRPGAEDLGWAASGGEEDEGDEDEEHSPLPALYGRRIVSQAPENVIVPLLYKRRIVSHTPAAVEDEEEERGRKRQRTSRTTPSLPNTFSRSSSKAVMMPPLGSAGSAGQHAR